MSGHTPGPWYAEEHGAYGYEVRAAGATSSMQVAKVPWTSTADEANAHLIAAAPELLKELENAAGQLCARKCTETWHSHDCVRRQALLAKVGGK